MQIEKENTDVVVRLRDTSRNEEYFRLLILNIETFSQYVNKRGTLSLFLLVAQKGIIQDETILHTC